MRSPAQTVAVSLPAVAKRKASRPSTDASPFSAQSNGCLPARKRRTQDVCRKRAPRRVAPSEREITEKCSTRRVLSRPNPTARWARRASGGGAATTWTVHAWRPRAGAVATTFLRAGDGARKPRVLCLHGADSNALEWRHIVRALADEGYDCTSLDWWSGGWTARDGITRVLQSQPTPPRPWELVRAHIHAFWQAQLDSEPVVLVGASLGGAVAIDFAAAHPEAIAALVLVDAGGESYKSPSPDAVTALSNAA